MRGACLFAWLLAVVPLPALADVTARYGESGEPVTVAIEVATNGDARIDMDGQHILQRNNENYMLIDADGTSYAVKFSDFMTAVAERPDQAKALTDEVLGDDSDLFSQMGKGKPVANGTRTIDGETGQAWSIRTAQGETTSDIWLVSSDNPALRPVGKAVARLLDILRMMTGAQAGNLAPFQKILETASPIQIDDMTLLSIDTTPIAAEHFLIRGRLLTLAELRASLAGQ